MTESEGKKNVLFVDDEQAVLDTLRRILRGKRHEWSMSFANGVDAAIEVLEGGLIDTVVSDINMPLRDGFDLLRTIREHPEWSTIPVIILTGNGESGLKTRALDLGATDLLNKPVDPDDLVARIRSVLRIKQYEDDIKQQSRLLEEQVRVRTSQLELAQRDLIWRLGKAGEFRDSDTGFHVVRVGFFARQLGQQLGLDDEFNRKVFLTAPLHDIGKIGIPDGILLKPGKLTEDEFDVMRKHTTMGAQILRDKIIEQEKVHLLGVVAGPARDTQENPFTEMAARIAESHHERWDGKGYPLGLGGDHIPLEARITSVADVYDALCSKRPYKKAMEHEQVMEIMSGGAGSQFDPNVFEAFLQSEDEFESIRAEFADPEESQPQADILESIDDLKGAA